MKNYLPFLQIITAVLLIALILLQQSGSGLGSAFGSASSFYSSKRGVQKKIFKATVILGILFVAFALLNLVV